MLPNELTYRTEQQHAMSAHAQFKGSDEPVYCAVFGCAKPLTLPEQLAGKKCTGCMVKKDTIFKHYKL